MTHFDVFNGDADGLCALQQLRLATPKDAMLVSGVKRDVALLQRVRRVRAGDSVTVLDLSLAVNRPALLSPLQGGVRVEYFDHHFAGELPDHPNLTALIDPSPDACTGIPVDRHLRGRYRIWAVVAAYGDNLARVADEMARPQIGFDIGIGVIGKRGAERRSANGAPSKRPNSRSRVRRFTSFPTSRGAAAFAAASQTSSPIAFRTSRMPC